MGLFILFGKAIILNIRFPQRHRILLVFLEEINRHTLQEDAFARLLLGVGVLVRRILLLLLLEVPVMRLVNVDIELLEVL